VVLEVLEVLAASAVKELPCHSIQGVEVGVE
jgi:hypothetical protein